MSRVENIVEFMLILVLVVMVLVVFVVCFLMVDYYIRKFFGMIDPAITVSMLMSAVSWGRG